MVSCCVLDCSVTPRNNSGNYSFHRFPQNPELRQKWLRAVDRKTWTPQKYSVICSKHFEPKYFRGKVRTKLRIDSIPTLFVPVLVNTDDTEPGPSKRTRHDSNSSTDSDSNEKIIEQCRFCAGYSKDCMDTCYIPFLMENKASIIFNDLSVKLDFTDNALPQTVCRDCNSKLQEIINFITQVTEAQKKFKVKAKNNRKVYEFKNETVKEKNKQTSKKHDSTRDTIEKETITRNDDDDDEDTRDAFEHRDIKVEYESPTDEDTHKIKIEHEPDDNTEITDSLPAEEPVLFRGNKRKNEDTTITKKAKVICEDVALDMDIKEEVTNDANEDYPEVQVQYDSGTATTGIGTTGTVTTEDVTTGIDTTGTDSTGIDASSALASVKYITIDGTTGRFSVKSVNKRKETE
ncbi:uncharacterized protein LOC134752724 isoform X3 [Cydia strobilella]|uniref:uncharacterized protein LOC134752724 isoform X3 n=1 Tax=Cydia strobilella TaxID=1100964 RepID=UPI003006F9A3